MSAMRFYEPEGVLATGQEYQLSVENHKHLKVLRGKIGAEIVLFNGQGGEYAATLIEKARHHSIVKLGTFNATNRKSSPAQHLAVADCSGHKIAWIVQKATELGVTSIQPLQTRYSKFAAKNPQHHRERLQRIAIQACEQSGINLVPKVHASMALTEFLQTQAYPQLLICSPSETNIASYTAKAEETCWMVGPEGGWHAQELEQARQQSAVALGLAPSILRMETAVCFVLAVANIWQAGWAK